jgi:site-specific recombinase XerD
MIRAGVSLPALMRLMGHAHIHTTMLYIQLTPQDVFAEYARAVERIARLAQPPLE